MSDNNTKKYTCPDCGKGYNFLHFCEPREPQPVRLIESVSDALAYGKQAEQAQSITIDEAIYIEALTDGAGAIR